MFYAIKGGILTEDGTSAYEAALARGLKADLDFIELRLSENSGKSLMKDGFGVADVSREVCDRLSPFTETFDPSTFHFFPFKDHAIFPTSHGSTLDSSQKRGLAQEYWSFHWTSH